MYIMLVTVFSLLAYAVATAFFVWYGVSLLDFCMDYPNPMWKIRFNAAKRATDDVEKLNKWLDTASKSSLADKADMMAQHYEEIASKNPRFKRWICVYCMSTFIGIFITSLVALIIVSLYGKWVILYWFAVFPTIGFIGARN